MKKLSITLLCCVCFALTVSAQTFKETLKEFITSQTSGVLTGDMSKLFKDFSKEESMPALAKQYAKEQMMDDMIDIMVPYFEDKVTENDLKELTSFYKKPKTQEALGRLKVLADAFSKKNAVKEFFAPFTKLALGAKPDNLKLREGISKKYFKACNKYCKDAGIMKTVEQVEKAITQVPLPSDGVAEIMLDYLHKNLPTFLANTASQCVTLEDFDTMSEVFKTKAFKHFEAGKDAMMSDVMNIGIKLLEKINKWSAERK